MKRAFFAALAMTLACASARAAEVGGPVEVAPQTPGPARQNMPAVAWCEGAKCWLVAWREGALNEGTDIWCARVSADGKALDPAGVCVSKSKGVKERLGVASDGQGFLVVWDDDRNGKDYDVYAARVSADGKLLDEKGVLVGGGAHNQCRPAVAFVGGSYFIAWQGFVTEGMPGGRFHTHPGGYVLFGARVSPDGKVLDGSGLSLGGIIDGCQAYGASAVRMGDKLLLSYALTPARAGYTAKAWGAMVVNPATGQVEGKSSGHMGQEVYIWGTSPSWGKEAGYVLAPLATVPTGGAPCQPAFWRIDKSGAIGKDAIRVTDMGLGDRGGPLVFDGEKFLWVTATEEKSGAGGYRQRIETVGRTLSPDGKVSPVFKIASDQAKSQIPGGAASGTAGVCLVTYVEPRGADDVKILARVVKAP